MKEMGKVILILAAGILLGFGALCLVHLLPVEPMRQNMAASRGVINSYAQTITGYSSTSIDNYTDSIILNEAICPVEAPLLEKVIYNYQVNYYRQYDQQENLLRYLDGEEGYGYQGYTHYWGGHQVVLKPLLLLFDHADILACNMIMQTLLAAFIVVGLCRKEKQHVILPFLASMLSIMPMTIAICLQYCDVYYITLIGTAIIVWKYDRVQTEKIYLLFLALGMATSYFDFLTYPFVSLGIPLVMFLAFICEKNVIEKIKGIALSSSLWCLGYGGMWAGKWILGSVLLPESEAISEALRALAYRGSNQAQGKEITVFDVLLENLYVYLKWPVMILIAVVAGYYMWKIFQRRALGKRFFLLCIPYVLLALYPVAWYMIAGNHSYEHAFMAYRELVIATFAGLCMLAELGNGRKDYGKVEQKFQS